MVAEQRQVGGPQQRQQGLHAVDGDALAELGQHVGHAAGHVVARAPGARAASSTARIRTSSVSSSSRHGTAIIDVDVDVGDRPLVGDGEHPHLGDLVAPELDAHRVLGGGREDVEDAAADRELASLADHVDAGVGQLDQPVR